MTIKSVSRDISVNCITHLSCERKRTAFRNAAGQCCIPAFYNVLDNCRAEKKVCRRNDLDAVHVLMAAAMNKYATPSVDVPIEDEARIPKTTTDLSNGYIIFDLLRRARSEQRLYKCRQVLPVQACPTNEPCSQSTSNSTPENRSSFNMFGDLVPKLGLRLIKQYRNRKVSYRFPCNGQAAVLSFAYNLKSDEFVCLTKADRPQQIGVPGHRPQWA